MIGFKIWTLQKGLKQLLMDSGLTIESILRLGSKELSEILHTDPYVGKLIVEAARKLIVEAAKNMVQESYIQSST
jgi:hypothetical protein